MLRQRGSDRLSKASHVKHSRLLFWALLVPGGSGPGPHFNVRTLLPWVANLPKCQAISRLSCDAPLSAAFLPPRHSYARHVISSLREDLIPFDISCQRFVNLLFYFGVLIVQIRNSDLLARDGAFQQCAAAAGLYGPRSGFTQESCLLLRFRYR